MILFHRYVTNNCEIIKVNTVVFLPGGVWGGGDETELFNKLVVILCYVLWLREKLPEKNSLNGLD